MAVTSSVGVNPSAAAHNAVAAGDSFSFVRPLQCFIGVRLPLCSSGLAAFKIRARRISLVLSIPRLGAVHFQAWIEAAGFTTNFAAVIAACFVLHA